jgi:hypothetical protein
MAEHTMQFIQRFIHSPSLLSFPFLLLLSLTLGLRSVREREQGEGEGQGRMIMQHYSTQHPARHTITHIHAGAVHTHTHSCSIRYKDTLSKKETTHTLVSNTTPKPISPPCIFKLSFTNAFNDTHTHRAPNLAL